MKKLILFFVLFSSINSAFAQNALISKQLEWKKTSIPSLREGQAALESFTFDGADFLYQTKGLPWFGTTFPVAGNGELNVQIVNPRYEPLELNRDIDTRALSDKLNIQQSVSMNGKSFNGKVRFIPIIKTASGLLKLVAFDIQATLIKKPLTAAFRGGPVKNSALKDGAIFKIAVENTGIQKIDAKLLKDLGIDITKVDPKKIKIYGNGAGMLPELNRKARQDDLAENPIIVSGEDDGKFNDNDFILFYGVGASRWDYDTTTTRFVLEQNVYSFTSNYFIKIDGENGKRITERPSLNNTAFTTNSSDYFVHYEKESINLLGSFNYTTGSGRDWYGEKLTPNKSSITINDLSIPNIDATQKAHISAIVAVRSSSGGDINIDVQGNQFTSAVGAVDLAEHEFSYASIGKISTVFSPKGDNFASIIRVDAGGAFEAWLDLIEINARRQLVMSGSQTNFRDKKTLAYPTSTFELKNANGIEIWNVTNPSSPVRQQVSNNNGTASFGLNTNELQEFVAFNASANDLAKPKAIGKVENQNLHSIERADMAIIYPKEFEAEAKRLAEHRRSFNKLNVVLATTEQIYNEFSSGALDVTAIRDFAKMLYERDSKFKYLLLMGDGSFNHRGIGVDADKNNNRVPVYETEESLVTISSFPSDDYFALLSPTEGDSGLNGDLDICVGRLTAQDEDQLKGIVTKIINYDKSPNAMRDFRNRVVFITDDFEDQASSWEEGFLTHSEENLWGQKTSKPFPAFNGEKIYLSAFPQVTTPGGQRSPDCQEAINNNMFKGSLITNYVGHGGPRGWTQERILNANEDIPTWSNFERLPLMITATCSFGGYDNPNNFTAGEQVLALDKGGAVGLFSTVRSVYSNANDALTASVFNEIYKKTGYNGLAMGEILRQAKNKSGTDTYNNRKFAMLGDPSQRLMIPQYNVKTTSINGKNVQSANAIDTIGALSRVQIKGVITDSTGKTLDWFNGIVYPTIFDKRINLKTLPIVDVQQDFTTQNRVLYKGSATVRNGVFTFNCVIPKDIDYNLGFAKISYYASNDVNDAAGYDNTHLVVGGNGKDAIKDDSPPTVEVFMDNEEFVSGGLTSKNPTLVVRLKDDYGMNISGSSIGHDMKAVLDDNTQNTYRLNDFYEAINDSLASIRKDNLKGKVKYQLSKLSEGTHKISVKAWDLANNPGEGATDFVVSTNGKGALEHVLNYPNPFTTSTKFQFRHHLPEVNIKVQVKIFTVSGKLIKTLYADANTVEGRVAENVEWDGKDDFGDDIGRGVYLYKVHIESPRNSALSEDSDFEKLVILK
jgi:hypothetical protein